MLVARFVADSQHHRSNRMDSGRFESAAKPYPFHRVLKGILIPLRLAARARDLDLITELDPRIDLFARRALYLARGESEAWIESQLGGYDETADMDNGDGFVVGDEHRLRQVVTNLARFVLYYFVGAV